MGIWSLQKKTPKNTKATNLKTSNSWPCRLLGSQDFFQTRRWYEGPVSTQPDPSGLNVSQVGGKGQGTLKGLKGSGVPLRNPIPDSLLGIQSESKPPGPKLAINHYTWTWRNTKTSLDPRAGNSSFGTIFVLATERNWHKNILFMIQDLNRSLLLGAVHDFLFAWKQPAVAVHRTGSTLGPSCPPDVGGRSGGPPHPEWTP